MAQAQAQHSTPQGALDTALGPFATLSIWREKLQADLSEPGADQLRLLLQQGTDVEQAGARAGGREGGAPPPPPPPPPPPAPIATGVSLTSAANAPMQCWDA